MENRGTFCCWDSPFSSFCLQLSPTPYTAPKYRWPSHPPVRSVYIQSSTRRSAIGPWLALLHVLQVTVCFSRLSSQKLMLQLLPLAQAACDYLKPQPFIYEKWEPDIRLIDCHLLKYQLVQWKEKLTCSVWIMELFLDLWGFSVPSLIEVIKLLPLLIEKGNWFSHTGILNALIIK